MRRKVWMAAVLVLTFADGSRSSWASGPGTTAANVLNFGVGARAVGMGEAYTALADDVSSLYWNPAGIAILQQSEASFMYNPSLKDMNYSHASVGVPLENGGLGAGVSYLTFGKIDGFDATGNPTGNVDAYSGVATLGGGWLFDNGALGFNVKGVQASLADVKAAGAAFDAGGTFVYPHVVLGESTLRLAATVRNLGPGLNFLQQTDPYPTEWRVGMALLQLLREKVNLREDYGKARDTDGAFYTGLEYRINPYIALRTGYAGAHTEGNGLRAGVGLRFKDILFDYAYAAYGDLGLTHRYELSYRFGEIRPLLTPEERKLLRRAKTAMREQRFDEAVLLLNSLIKLVPNYKPVRRLIKLAMAGLEQQERLAQGQKNFNFSVLDVKKKSSGSLSDLDDLEQLLNLSDQAITQGPKRPAGSTAPGQTAKEQ